VDRFGAVVFPLCSPLISSNLCPFFILATWIIAVAVSSPYLVAFEVAAYADGKGRPCLALFIEAIEESSSYANYTSAFIVVFLYVPIALLVIIYSVIVIKLKTQKIPGEQSNNAGQQRAKRNQNVLKMAIAIVFGFVLCWVPWSVISLLSFFALELPCGYYSTHFSITRLNSFSNCAIKLADLSSVRQWFEAIEEFLSYAKYTSALTVVFLYVPMAVLTILYSIRHQTHDTEDSR